MTVETVMAVAPITFNTMAKTYILTDKYSYVCKGTGPVMFLRVLTKAMTLLASSCRGTAV